MEVARGCFWKADHVRYNPRLTTELHQLLGGYLKRTNGGTVSEATGTQDSVYYVVMWPIRACGPSATASYFLGSFPIVHDTCRISEQARGPECIIE